MFHVGVGFLESEYTVVLDRYMLLLRLKRLDRYTVVFDRCILFMRLKRLDRYTLWLRLKRFYSSLRTPLAKPFTSDTIFGGAVARYGGLMLRFCIELSLSCTIYLYVGLVAIVSVA